MGRCNLINALLPPEVFDLIYATLRVEDPLKDALFAASLVCRSWREQTLRHRFHSLCLKVHEDGSVRPPTTGDGGPLRFEEFEDMVIVNTVKGLVRALSLNFVSGGISHAFLHFVDVFPAVHSLKLMGAFRNTAYNYAKPSPCISFDSLTVHGMQSPYGPDGQHNVKSLCSVLSQFSSVRELSIVGLYGLLMAEDPTWSTVALPSVSSLTLVETSTIGLTAVLIRQLAQSGALRHIDLLAYHGEALDDGVTLAKTLPSPPDHISVSVTGWGLADDEDTAGPRPDLSGIPAIRRLSIAVELEIAKVGADSIDDWQQRLNSITWTRALKTLRSLDTSCRLTRVDLRLASADHESSDGFLPRMHVALCQECSARTKFEDVLVQLARQRDLQVVCVSLYCMPPTDGEPISDWYISPGEHLETMFPALSGTGIMRV